MKHLFVLTGTFCWLLCLIPHGWQQACFGLLAGLFLFFRFRRKWMPLLLWGFCFCLFALHPFYRQDISRPPQAGLYEIVSVRSKYVIARHENGQQVLVYDQPEAVRGDQLKLNTFEKIHSLKNESLFSFEDHMAKRGIVWQAALKEPLEYIPADSLPARVSAFIARHPQSRVLRLFLYGLHHEDMQPFYLRLGFGVCAFAGLLQGFLQRWVNRPQTSLVCALFLAVHGFLFTWNLSMFRLLVFFVMRFLVPGWEARWLAQILCFLLFVPWAASEFCFVLPLLLSFCTRMEPDHRVQKALTLTLLAGLQILYFRSLSWFSLMGFSWMRRLWAAGYLLSLVLLLCPVPLPLADLFCQELPSLMELSFHGEFVWWMKLAFFGTLGFVLHSRRRLRALALAAVMALYPVSFVLDPFFHFYMLDIGQGDCMVAVLPWKQSAILIDAAGHTSRDNAAQIIVPFLQAKGIRSLDAVILTHEDMDHSGAAPGVLEAIPAKKVITNTSPDRDLDFPVTFLLEEREAADENDRSLILWLEYDEFSWLLTGDASSEIEKQLIQKYELHADILKFGHHGSATSSDPAFLKAVSARIGLVSCGYQNRYGHPSLQALQQAEMLSMNVLDTPGMGSLHFMSLKGHLLIQSGRGYFSWLPARVQASRTVP